MKKDGAASTLLDDVMHKMKEEKDVYCKIHVKTSLKVDSAFEKPGKKQFVYGFLFRKNMRRLKIFKLLNTSHEGLVNDNSVDQRCVYIEKPYEKR